MKLKRTRFSLLSASLVFAALLSPIVAYQVPLKVFLEDGVIKKTWVEATVTDQRKSDFSNWLNAL
jgi:hypothetical protein